MIKLRAVTAWLLLSLTSFPALAKPVHHYVFFGMDRERIKDEKPFLETKSFEGAQVSYSWRQLEPAKDQYDFSRIREDLALLKAHGKKLWIQLHDVSFSATRINVPKYLTTDPEYNGGADKQYHGDSETPKHSGWMARRWDPAVQERFHKLLMALGKEFDGQIAGINLQESAGIFRGTTKDPFPKDFSPEIYRDAIITNMKALRRAFPKSIAMQYANFMPGEWRPTADRGYLRAVYDAARESKIAVGGPDLFPFKPGQMGSSYSLIHEMKGKVPIGIAVQDGNYEYTNPKTGKRITLEELLQFATDYLHVDYIFWSTEEPYYSAEVIPFIRKQH